MPKLQRLLYINCESTHPQSPALSAAIYEPVAGAISQLDPTGEGVPYASVQEAMIERLASHTSPRCVGWHR